MYINHRLNEKKHFLKYKSYTEFKLIIINDYAIKALSDQVAFPQPVHGVVKYMESP